MTIGRALLGENVDVNLAKVSVQMNVMFGSVKPISGLLSTGTRRQGFSYLLLNN
jgi:hypothetical protein